MMPSAWELRLHHQNFPISTAWGFGIYWLGLTLRVKIYRLPKNLRYGHLRGKLFFIKGFYWDILINICVESKQYYRAYGVSSIVLINKVSRPRWKTWTHQFHKRYPVGHSKNLTHENLTFQNFTFERISLSELIVFIKNS